MSGGARNEAVIFGYLKSLGFTDAGAAAALGNFEVETGSKPFSPTAYNAGERAIGIAQWEGARRTALQAYAAAHGGKETDLAMQLGYLGTELRGGYRRILRVMQTTNDPTAAAAVWDVGAGGANSGTGFENSSGDATGLRQSDAGFIYSAIRTGALTAKKAPGVPGGVATVDGGGLGGVLNDLGGAAGTIGGGVVSAAEALNPFSWFGDLMRQVAALVIKAMFVLLGLGTMLLGLYATARKATQ